MFISHVYFYLFQIIFTFQCSFSAVLNMITQDSERLYNSIISHSKPFSIFYHIYNQIDISLFYQLQNFSSNYLEYLCPIDISSKQMHPPIQHLRYRGFRILPNKNVFVYTNAYLAIDPPPFS